MSAGARELGIPGARFLHAYAAGQGTWGDL